MQKTIAIASATALAMGCVVPAHAAEYKLEDSRCVLAAQTGEIDSLSKAMETASQAYQDYLVGKAGISPEELAAYSDPTTSREKQQKIVDKLDNPSDAIFLAKETFPTLNAPQSFTLLHYATVLPQRLTDPTGKGMTGLLEFVAKHPGSVDTTTVTALRALVTSQQDCLDGLKADISVDNWAAALSAMAESKDEQEQTSSALSTVMETDYTNPEGQTVRVGLIVGLTLASLVGALIAYDILGTVYNAALNHIPGLQHLPVAPGLPVL